MHMDFTKHGALIAERLSEATNSASHLGNSVYVCIYVCTYVSVTLRNAIISRATRKRTCTCASVKRIARE